jgi:cobalt-zinc-cadmium efflux system membrane fusion protein
MTVCTPGTLRVVMDLGEANYFVVPGGTKATVTPVAYPEMRIEGGCDAKARTPTTGQNGAIYSMPVELGMVDRKLIPGERAAVEVHVPEMKDVLLAPATAVVKGFVWVHADGKDEKRAVVTGRAEGKSIEIVSGVKEGERVLTVGKS